MPTCTYKKDCREDAISSYVFGWGDDGLCCPVHQVEVGQVATNLNQTVQINPLTPGSPPPVTREQRIQAHATALALEEENAELRQNAMDLYHQLESFKQQVSTLSAQKTALEANLAEVKQALEKSRQEEGRLRQQAASENQELRRLRALVPQKVDRPPHS